MADFPIPREFSGSAEPRFVLRENQRLAPTAPQNLDQFLGAIGDRFRLDVLASRAAYTTFLGMAGEFFSVAGFAIALSRRWGRAGQFLASVLADEIGSAFLTCANREGGRSLKNAGLDLFEGVIHRGVMFALTPRGIAAPLRWLRVGGGMFFGSFASRLSSHIFFSQANPFADLTGYGIALQALDMAMLMGQGQLRRNFVDLERTGRSMLASPLASIRLAAFAGNVASHSVSLMAGPPPGSGRSQRSLVDDLVDANFGTAEEIRAAGQEARSKRLEVWDVLAERLVQDPARLELLREVVAKSHNVQSLARDKFEPAIQSIGDELRPAELAARFHVLPMSRSGTNILILMSDPMNISRVDEIKSFFGGYNVIPLLGFRHEIDELTRRHFGVAEAEVARGPTDEEVDPASLAIAREVTVDTSDAGARDPSIITWVNRLLLDAHHRGASDIHIEPRRGRLSIRLRVNGELVPYLTPANEAKAAGSGRAIVARIVVMANLKLDQMHLPQSGRIALRGKDRRQLFDLRVEVRPTLHGPEVVLRILGVEIPNLGDLMTDVTQLDRLRTAATQPNGLILVTGPTGSGKTTTLYALLRELNQGHRMIATVEDPIEYQLENASQTQVNLARELDFPDILRSLLRSDPDIILVGEIRDAVTAKIAAQAAETGHLVLSTLHTNDALATAERLLDMGVDDYVAAGILRAVVSQRLARRNCRHCAEVVADPDSFRRPLGLDAATYSTLELKVGAGCSHCRNTGCEGRVGVYEVVPANQTVVDYVTGVKRGTLSRADAEQKLRAEGVKLLRDAAVDLLLQGVISPREALRVLGERF